MKIRALTSFCGVLNMAKDQELEYDNEVVLQDLVNAGYVEEITEETPKRSVKKSDSKRNNGK